MKSLVSLAALAGLAAGIRHFLNFLNEHEKNRVQEKRLEIWEGEGGAVPVAQSRTAAQVKPGKRPPVSPGGVN